jgi:hypothetical protein
MSYKSIGILKGGRASYFWEEKPPPPFIMDGRHPERPPRLAAQPVAARRSWAAPGLNSGRFVVAAAAI